MKPFAMTAEQPSKLSALINRLADWRRRWATRNATLADLSLLNAGEYERVAHDVGVDGAELRILAGKWPDSAELLSRRLADLKLDEHRLRDAQPHALRDLQRVCSLCSDKGRCEHDLDRHAKPARWRAYCPNA